MLIHTLLRRRCLYEPGDSETGSAEMGSPYSLYCLLRCRLYEPGGKLGDNETEGGGLLIKICKNDR